MKKNCFRCKTKTSTAKRPHINSSKKNGQFYTGKVAELHGDRPGGSGKDQDGSIADGPHVLYVGKRKNL